ncbi:MAG: hypothetical protein JWN00_1661 [Actinomycetia bacterium]|nr:hypothetical protein [Actinomycetes bacterium]
MPPHKRLSLLLVTVLCAAFAGILTPIHALADPTGVSTLGLGGRSYRAEQYGPGGPPPARPSLPPDS